MRVDRSEEHVMEPFKKDALPADAPLVSNSDVDEAVSSPNTEAEDSVTEAPQPLHVKLSHGGRILFHGTRKELKKRYPGAEVLKN